jgi:hypothetical protein
MDALEIKEVNRLRQELDERATTQYVDGSDVALQRQLDTVFQDLDEAEQELVAQDRRLDALENERGATAEQIYYAKYRPNHFGTQPASTISDFSEAVGVLLKAYDVHLQDGVPEAGNTLQKLYNLIAGQFSEVTVATVADRNAYTIPKLPFNVFVSDDGDGRWALYRATSTGQNAAYVKLSDPDLLNERLSASQIKAAYESNPDTNALTNALLIQLQNAASKDELAALQAAVNNKTNNATTAALSTRVLALESVLLDGNFLNATKQDWAGLTPLQAIYRLINEGSGTSAPATPSTPAAPTGLQVDYRGNTQWNLPAGEVPSEYEFYLS